VIAARSPGSIVARAVSAIAVLGLSIPQFWLGLMLITGFAAGLHWLPAAGIRPIGSVSGVLDILPYLILPLIVLSVGPVSTFIRFTRSAMRETLAEDYIRVARGKGLRERAVLFRHALPNALITVVSLTGTMIPILLSNIVVVESVFALPGLGRLSVAAAISGDYPVVFTANMVAAIVVLLSSLLADVAYVLVDPRVRL
jgi:peptide/nickel transport system permease protein